jgi:site-specific recombinase XerD
MSTTQRRGRAAHREVVRGTFAKRNRALFIVGYHTEFGIRELLSLIVGDVQQHGKIVDDVAVQRKHMKKKTEGRTVPLHPEARAALSVWLEVLQKMLKDTRDPQTPVFCSRVSDTATGLRRAISREQAWSILKEVFASHELTGKLGTHAMGKTFAHRMYEKLNRDLVKVQRAMGHRTINSTVAYLSVREEDIADAILAA